MFDEKTIRMKHSKGLVYISYLLIAPGKEFHAVQLYAGAEGQLSTPVRTSAGEMSDPPAMHQYKARAEEIKGEIEVARKNNDVGRMAASDRT